VGLAAIQIKLNSCSLVLLLLPLLRHVSLQANEDSLQLAVSLRGHQVLLYLGLGQHLLVFAFDECLDPPEDCAELGLPVDLSAGFLPLPASYPILSVFLQLLDGILRSYVVPHGDYGLVEILVGPGSLDFLCLFVFDLVL